MGTSDSTKASVYVEVLAFAASALIVTAIFIVEATWWYLENKTAKSNDTQNQIAIGMTIDGATANPPSPDSQCASSDDKSVPVTASAPTDRESESQPSPLNPFMRILTMITYISYICYSATAITAKLGMHGGCDKSVALPSFFYMISKSCLYLVLLYRIYFVYRHSVFQKSTTLLKVAATFTVSWGLFISISNVALLDIQTIQNDDGSVYCQQTSNDLLVLLFIFFDFIINIGCCYSFTRPLLWLSRMDRSDSSESNVQFVYNIVVKYVILTVVAVMSTFLSLLPLILLGIQWSPAVDVVVNCFCIMLFNKSYDRYYKRLCCGARAIGHCIIQMECCYGTKTESKDASS